MTGSPQPQKKVVYYESEDYDDFTFPYVAVEVKNDSSHDVEFDVDDASVNGLLFFYHCYDTVKSGKTATIYLKTNFYDLTYIGQSDVENLQLRLEAYDADSYDDICTGELCEIQLTDDYTPFEISRFPHAVPLVSVDGATVYFIEALDLEGDDELDFMFYMENKTAHELYFDLDHLTINGTSQDSNYYAYVPSGLGIIVNLYCDDESITESDVTSGIVTITIDDTDDYTTLADAEEIPFIQLQ